MFRISNFMRLLAQAEAMAYMDWVKKFASAYLAGQEG